MSGQGRFQCTADGWAVGPPQECPEDGCRDHAALVSVCRERFGDRAHDLARTREHLAPAIGYVDEDEPAAGP
jgi:hypothetical protein